MKPPYSEVDLFPPGHSPDPALPITIDRAIAVLTKEWRPLQMPAGLLFPNELEALYETDTRESRVRELQFTVSAAAAFQFVTLITDPIFVPDLGRAGLWLRVLVAICMMSTVVSYRWVSAAAREVAVCGAAFSFLLAIAALIWMSHSSLAAYEVFPYTLGFVYANTTTPLRFRYAWQLNVAGLSLLFLALLTNPRVNTGLAGALIFLATVGSSYSLIANYRMERASRLAYLLASKEALRLVALGQDRDHLEVVSNTDGLTGLANRGHFNRSLAASFKRAAREEKLICLLLLDVDFFKRYNDRYGHPAGDARLRQIAEVLTRVMRDTKDLPFRYGGEEFGVLLSEITTNHASQIAERIRNAIETAGMIHENREDGLEVVTVSIGVAYAFQHSFQPEDDTTDDLLARADQALYLAKRNGRNRVEVDNLSKIHPTPPSSQQP